MLVLEAELHQPLYLVIDGKPIGYVALSRVRTHERARIGFQFPQNVQIVRNLNQIEDHRHRAALPAPNSTEGKPT